jgi:predicted small lipoprotein YifL
MLSSNLEPSVTRPVGPRLALIGIGALAVALLLAGCGRKGPLDPPPGGWEVPSRSGMTPVTNNPAPPAPQEYDDEGRPIAPVGRNRRLPIDSLLN